MSMGQLWVSNCFKCMGCDSPPRCNILTMCKGVKAQGPRDNVFFPVWVLTFSGGTVSGVWEREDLGVIIWVEKQGFSVVGVG